MASNILGVCLLFFIVLLVEANPDGICSRTELTGALKLVRKWRYINGRRKTYMDYEPVKKEILGCCDGYLQLLGSESPPICSPLCEPPCTNGDCIEPNICRCVPGYEFRNGTCQPVCSEPCKNGTCVAPETCKCLPGYRMTDVNVCTPECSSGCGNGSCISPEVCYCNYGFASTNGTCEPRCWPPCETGECIAPDTCSCGLGYERVMTNVSSCEPICSPTCENGVCVGPNVCMCDKGYENQNGTCQPVCSNSCINGTCVAPETCGCFEGYILLYEYICFPTCNAGCGFGWCIGPEVCQCFVGFSLINGTCKPICSPPCVNGVCTSSFNCNCNPGYELQNDTCKPKISWPNADKEMITRKGVTYANDEHDEGTTWAENYTSAHYLPKEKLQKSSVTWMYFVIPVLVLLMIGLIIVLIWKRHFMVEYCAGRTYKVSDRKNTESMTKIPDLTLSVIKEKQAARGEGNSV